jgi:hypothetical protein
MNPFANLLIYAAVTLTAFYLFRRALSKRAIAPLPPGPPGLPLIGNLFDIPDEGAWLAFSQWAKRYGMLHEYALHGPHS